MSAGVMPTLVFGLLAEWTSVLVWRGLTDGVSYNLLSRRSRPVLNSASPASFWFWWVMTVALSLFCWIIGATQFRHLLAARGPGTATFVGLCMIAGALVLPALWKKP